MAGDEVHEAAFAELDVATLYAILKLRSDVFVVEQACAFADPDGRDTEASARHLWIERDGIVVAYLRVLVEPGGEHRIGRVVTHPTTRGERLAEQLMVAALAGIGAGEAVVLDAQSRLVAWYERLGFERSADDFWEDGILHTPMRRS